MTHYCTGCDDWTDFEREATLPPECKSGDPDYQDNSKCGVCGEPYQCQECGGEWNVDENECEEVLDHGYHGFKEE